MNISELPDKGLIMSISTTTTTRLSLGTENPQGMTSASVVFLDQATSGSHALSAMGVVSVGVPSDSGGLTHGLVWVSGGESGGLVVGVSEPGVIVDGGDSDIIGGSN